jgi:Tfp pilus assembly protein PilV
MHMSLSAATARQNGTTLIEALIALAVVSAGLLAITALMTRAMHIRIDDTQWIRAERLMADAGEIAAMLPAGDALSANLTADWQTRAANSLPRGDGLMTASTHNSLPGISARLSWVSRNGQPNQLQHFYPAGPTQ